ncbi:RDD family protein [Cognatishimia sp. F0-27]|uniref:RDD family protein n=1 Tax=Cognatishimia sp. F0-27 TaxID=2816855 RepID=UPI001D0C06C9|nr:RDD family protein [Cognatishimia sp. F0-27]MCC1494495.1 RDD family protein [Cognatishimia sp. F0-27]
MTSGANIFSHLPDPERQHGFYDGVIIKRGLAWVVDFVVIMALVIPVLVMTAFIGVFFLPFLFFVVGFFYRWMTLSSGSATWGMRLMAIELRNLDGHRLDGQQAFLHTLGYTVLMSTFLLQLVSIGFMFTNPRGQNLVDMFLGTVALNRRA